MASDKRFQKDDIDHFLDNDVYLPTRTLWMGSCGDNDGEESGTDYLMAERMIKNLHILDNMAGSNKPITIIMNNIGGDEYHGMAIFDAIKACQNHITIKIYGHAMSMGSIIIHAADEILMSKNSKMLLHYGTASVDSHSHAKDTYAAVDDAKKFDKLMEDIYLDKIKVKHPKYTRVQLKKFMAYDKYLSADEALDLGLIDGIIGEE